MSDGSWTPEQVGPKVESFLRPMLKQARLDLAFDFDGESAIDPLFERPDVTVRFSGRDVDLLLANKGELLLALEHLTREALRMRPQDQSRLLFDAQDYRMLRVEELRLSAEAAAERVKRTGVAFRFSAMNSRERRILHLALRGNSDVRTESEGNPPQRCLVVYPAGAT